MQKFTIFTIIFSTIVITIIAELVVSDYLQKLYANPQNLQASAISSSNFENFVAPFEQQDVEQSETAELARRLQQIAGTQTPVAEQDLSQAPIEQNVATAPTISTQTAPLTRVSNLLPALRIQGLQLSPKVYDNRLFQLISTEALDATRSTFATLDIDQEVMGSVYEFLFRTPVDAENAFDEIRILANSFPNIDTNQTNQFGDRSFYINNLVKVGEVFLVVQKDNYVYAFGYKRDSHETFKTF